MNREHGGTVLAVTVLIALAGAIVACDSDYSDASSPLTPTTIPANASSTPAPATPTGASGTMATLTAPPMATPTAVVAALPTPTLVSTPMPTPNPTPDPRASNPQIDPFTQAAVQDLAGRLSIPVTSVSVVSSESMVWPDKGYGCPRPGMIYAQVLSDGVRIVLKAGGAEYTYHSGDGRAPFLCEK